jgi:hypothetical protein
MALKKRLNLGSLMRKRSCESHLHDAVIYGYELTAQTAQDVHVDPDADTPEANAARGVVSRITWLHPIRES